MTPAPFGTHRSAVLPLALAQPTPTPTPTSVQRWALGLALALVLLPGSDALPGADVPAWVNVSEAFTKQIGAFDPDPTYPFLRCCQGLIVTPTGEVIMQTATQGICISKDQGATWAVVADNGITGRCENGFGFSLAYPYDGRMAFFCYDGGGGRSGGMSLDGAKTWTPFAQFKRGVQFGDVDWTATTPVTVLGVTHEPFYTVLSADAGKSWRQLDVDENGGEPSAWVGVIDATHLTRYNKATSAIEWSEDSGLTWSQVGYFRVLGNRPVHYGSTLYWTTAKGVIASTDGKTWALTGKGAEGATYGPFFGRSNQDFVVVSPSAFLRTCDGGKTWKPIAALYQAPDMFHASNPFYGWDATHDLLYASGLGGSVYRYAVAPGP